MNHEIQISEADRKLWHKIKRNGHFRKRKTELLKNIPTKALRSDILVVEESDIVSSCVVNTDLTDSHEYKNTSIADDEWKATHQETDDSDPEFETMQADPQAFCSEIKKWAIDFQIKHTALNALLCILKSHMPENVLPKCARALVNTPRHTDISSDERLGGKYWHYGLKKVLVDHLSEIENLPGELSLNVNIDGLPAFKSSSTSFWPILVNIHELREVLSPLIVGVFCGGSMTNVKKN